MSSKSAMSTVAVPRIIPKRLCLQWLRSLQSDVLEAVFVVSTGLLCMCGYALQTKNSVLERGYVISVCNVCFVSSRCTFKRLCW